LVQMSTQLRRLIQQFHINASQKGTVDDRTKSRAAYGSA